MRLHGIDHNRRFLVLAAQLCAELYMGSFHLMIHSLTNVMQKSCTLRHTDVQSEFPGKNTGELRNLNAVLQHILSVAGTIPEFTKETNELVVETMYANLQRSSFSLFLDNGLHFLLGLFNHFFDSGRMNSSIDDQFLQSNSGNLSSNRIKSRNDHRLRCVINDKIHAGHRLQSTDVPSLASDDPSLHLIVRKLYHGNGGFRNVIRRTSLDGTNHILASLLVRFFLRFRLDLLDHDGRIVSYIIFYSL